MYKNRFLLSLFLGLIILIPVFMGISNLFAGIVAILAVLVLMIAIVQFLSNYEDRSYKGTKIEFITFFRHHVLRTYLKPKTVWVVYDRIRMRFRPANFREFPIKVALSGIFGRSIPVPQPRSRIELPLQSSMFSRATSILRVCSSV